MYGINRRVYVNRRTVKHSSLGLFHLLWSWTTGQNWLHPDSLQPSSVHLHGVGFILQQSPNTPQSFDRTTWSLKKTKESRLSWTSLWRLTHWTFMRALWDWAICDIRGAFFGKLSYHIVITWVIRFCSKMSLHLSLFGLFLLNRSFPNCNFVGVWVAHSRKYT